MLIHHRQMQHLQKVGKHGFNGAGPMVILTRAMSKSDVEQDFPLLRGTAYDLSDEDFNYNCLAYALGDKSQWWEPPKGPEQYWPPGFSPDLSVETVVSIIKTHGFIVDSDTVGTPETDAIAIYAEGDEWTHFAKFSGGSWSCKLGDGHDVIGVKLENLVGTLYGNVVKVLRRPPKELQ
jgi:hypothetical protein